MRARPGDMGRDHDPRPDVDRLVADKVIGVEIETNFAGTGGDQVKVPRTWINFINFCKNKWMSFK